MKKLYTIFFLLAASVYGFAESRVLDLETALALAFENNLDLQNAQSNWEQSKKDAKASWNLWAPSLSASVSGSQSWSYSDMGESDSMGVSAGASARFSFNPSLSNQLKDQNLSEEQQSLRVQNARLQLRMQVEQEFYYLITVAENLEISQKNIELAEKSYDMTKIRFENGRASQLELMQAEVNAVNQQPSFSSLQAQYQNRLKVFLLLLGLETDSDVTLEGSLDVVPQDLDVEDLISRYLMDRNSIQQQQLEIHKRSNSLSQLQKSAFFPTLGISGSYTKRINEPLKTYSSDSDSISLSLTLSITLDNYLPDSSARRNIEKQQVALDQQQGQMEYMIQQASLEVVNLYNSLKTDQERLELSRLNNELAQASYDLTESQYNMGRVDRLTLENAQQELSKSRYNLLESKYQYIKDLIQLKGALGTETWDEWNQ